MRENGRMIRGMVMTCPVLLCHAMLYSAMPCPHLPYSVCQYTWTLVAATSLGSGDDFCRLQLRACVWGNACMWVWVWMWVWERERNWVMAQTFNQGFRWQTLHRWHVFLLFLFPRPSLLSCIHCCIFIQFSLGDGKFISNETGITYAGSWLDGLKHGLGTLYFESGDEIVGRWNEVSIKRVQILLTIHFGLPVIGVFSYLDCIA